MNMTRRLSIVVDTREQAPFYFGRYLVDVVPGALPTGDYSLPGFEDRVAIERKSVDDLVGCLKGEQRERFERELTRGRHYELFAVVVESSLAEIRAGRYRSEMRSESVIQSLAAFQARYRVAFCWCGTRALAEHWTFSLLSKYAEEQRIRFRDMERGQEIAI
jgi:ERCC4-type nuclease